MRRFLLFAAIVNVACPGTDPSQDLCKSLVAGDLVVTEFLSDPSGSDTGNEWVEIYNTRGTAIDLKGVTLYTKKVDGTGVKNAVIRAGTVASGGYFALGDVRMGALPSYIGYSYEDALGSLPNGTGIIGLKCISTVIDEIQYTVTPKAGHSRQLDGNQTPDSVVNDDETKFCDADQPLEGTSNFGTPGQANTPCGLVVGSGNCFETSTSTSRPVVPPAAGDVFFTEVMADPKAVSDTDGEWLELHAVNDVDLNGVVLGVSGSNHTLSSVSCLHMTSGSYAVLGKDLDAGVNGGLVNVMTTFTQSLGNSGGTLTLSLDDAGIDSATYGSATSGVALQLDPDKLDALSNDVAANYCNATFSFTGVDGGDLGTPGTANTACGVIPGGNQCLDPGTSQLRNIVTPGMGDLLITEVMADPKLVSDTVGEWIEVRAARDLDLNGVVLTVGTSAHALTSSSCLRLASGTYAVLAKTLDSTANGGLPTALTTFTQSLGNTGGTLSLSAGDAGVIDTAVYGAAIAGVAWQLDPAKLDALSNDDPANFCRATTHFSVVTGSDLGTPAAANTACGAGPVGGQCIDPLTSMMRNPVAAVPGDLVITEFMADPSAVGDASGEYIEVKSNSAVDLNGLVLGFDTSTSTVNNATCLAVAAGSYSVFAANADALANGGLPAVAGTFSFSLTNSGTHTLSLSNDAGLLDALVYSPDAGKPVTGASTQLSVQFSTPADNDVAANLCTTSASSRYGGSADAGTDGGATGDRGTPGLPNEMCP